MKNLLSIKEKILYVIIIQELELQYNILKIKLLQYAKEVNSHCGILFHLYLKNLFNLKKLCLLKLQIFIKILTKVSQFLIMKCLCLKNVILYIIFSKTIPTIKLFLVPTKIILVPLGFIKMLLSKQINCRKLNLKSLILRNISFIFFHSKSQKTLK